MKAQKGLVTPLRSHSAVPVLGFEAGQSGSRARNTAISKCFGSISNKHGICEPRGHGPG